MNGGNIVQLLSHKSLFVVDFLCTFCPKNTASHWQFYNVASTLSSNCIFVYSIDLSVAIPLTYYILIIAFRKYTHNRTYITILLILLLFAFSFHRYKLRLNSTDLNAQYDVSNIDWCIVLYCVIQNIVWRTRLGSHLIFM